MRKIVFCSTFLCFLCVAAPTFGQFVVTEAGPVPSADAVGDPGNGTFSGTYAGASTVFGTLDFTGDLTEVISGTWASEARFELTNGGDSFTFRPSSVGLLTGTINVTRTIDTLYWISNTDMVNFESFDSFDDGAGADSTWANLSFTFDGTPSFTNIGTFAPGSFTFDTLGSDFDTEIALYTSDGVLIDNNDDAGGTLQSSITQSLTVGDYIVVVGGFNSVFFNGAATPGTAAGDFILNLDGSSVDSGTFASGGLANASFSIVLPAVHLANNDGLGDAGLFQYYTVNGGWQTFIRVINTSNDAVSFKVRFREAANSREVLDFIVFLSPHDTWAGWTDADATDRGHPGVRTMDTSCLYPLPDTNNTTEGWKSLSGNLLGADFQERAYTGVYDDNGNVTHTELERMSEGHLEIIGIAAHNANSAFGRAVTHDHFTGVPSNCTEASNLFEAQVEGGEGFDLGNVLAMNGYVINVALGQGGGFDPDILADFNNRSLVEDALMTATDPDMDSSGSSAPLQQRTKQKGQLGEQPVTGGVDAVSRQFQRTSVMNEWAASANPGNVVSDYFTQWILTFPTKHYYVDLQNDMGPLDDISPTLWDPSGDSPDANNAFAPFNEEFDWSGGQSCEPYRMRIWNREESKSEWTSPAPIYPVELCNETNVLVFNQYYEDKGLNSAFPVTIPFELLPVDAGGATSERGWASMDFFDWNGTDIDPAIENNRWIWDRAGLPVTGWLFSVFNTNDNATNHTTINAHKSRRTETIQELPD